MHGRSKITFAKVFRILRECDVALEVLDSRDIDGTRIRKLDTQLRDKVVLVASKADLVPDRAREKTLDGMPLFFFSSRTREGLAGIFREIRKRARQKNLPEARVAVFGLPNTGKSSLINVMRGRKTSPTGFRPGITRGAQWVRIRSGILLLDNPGVVGLKQSNEQLALLSAASAEELKDPEEVALSLIGKFIAKGSDSLLSHYGVAPGSPEEVLESIAKRRGVLLKGGEPNIPETAKIVLRDFQKGKFLL